MNTKRLIVLAVLTVAGGSSLMVARAQQAGAGDAGRAAPTAAAAAPAGTRGAPAGETVTPAADEPIPNLPGKRLVSFVVDYAPGGHSASHRHGRSAFIYAYVLSGKIRSQVNDGPVRVYRAGEAWFESPGAHHQVSENASDTEPARLLAVFIADAADKQLTTPDAR
jgi:quercetin dioxygenase-like cupin family protein